MGLLNLFKGKSPREHEANGDSQAQFGNWGRAKIEYEKALDKLGKEPPERQGRVKQLEDKIHRAKEKLAGEHIRQ